MWSFLSIPRGREARAQSTRRRLNVVRMGSDNVRRERGRFLAGAVLGEGSGVRGQERPIAPSPIRPRVHVRSHAFPCAPRAEKMSREHDPGPVAPSRAVVLAGAASARQRPQRAATPKPQPCPSAAQPCLATRVARTREPLKNACEPVGLSVEPANFFNAGPHPSHMALFFALFASFALLCAFAVYPRPSASNKPKHLFNKSIFCTKTPAGRSRWAGPLPRGRGTGSSLLIAPGCERAPAATAGRDSYGSRLCGLCAFAV
jgi:hypothetical protein